MIRVAGDPIERGRKPVTAKLRKAVTIEFVTPPAPATSDEPAGIYRHFSNDGELLYVGMSISPVLRTEGHRNSPWFKQVTRIEIQWLATYAEAIDAERRAIQTEMPRFNKVRYGGPTPPGVPRYGKPKGSGHRKIYASGAEKQKAYRARLRAKA